jgi:hypothetical protein
MITSFANMEDRKALRFLPSMSHGPKTLVLCTLTPLNVILPDTRSTEEPLLCLLLPIFPTPSS